MVEISTSILSIKKENSIKTLYDLEVAHTDYFHIDVMDGKFVEKNTKEQMIEYTEYIKNISTLPIDVHLMVQDIKEGIKDFISLNPSIITFHIEATKDEEEVFELINLIKENNIKVGIAIKPNTDISKLYKFLPYIHIALIMTVEPGKGGQKLIPNTIYKIEKLNKYIQENNLDTYIEADGGINMDTANKVKEAGVDIIVAGTAIIDSNNFSETIKSLKNI